MKISEKYRVAGCVLGVFLGTLTVNLAKPKSSSYERDSVQIESINSVYDGDTFRVDIKQPKGTNPVFWENLSIRVKGVDTPEMRGKCPREVVLAKEARKLTVDFLSKQDKVLIDISRGKYFRIVADVKSGNEILSEKLIDSGLAVPYDGGTKTKDWCGE